MFLLGLWSVTSYMRAYSHDQIRPASTGRRSQWLLLGLGVSTSAMMMIMGVIREHARQPYLISGELTISQQQITNDQPSKKGGSIP
jgi:cytochrome bd-type quinol oxidase subunit 1